MFAFQDDPGQRRQMKTLFSGALRRTVESDKNTLHNKRTVHRGCHTGNITQTNLEMGVHDRT